MGSPDQRVADDATGGWSAEPLDRTEVVISGAAGPATADRDTTHASDGDQHESTGDAATAAAFDVDVPDPNATFEVADEATAPDAAERGAAATSERQGDTATSDPDEPGSQAEIGDDPVEVRRA